jgi:acetate kinase
MLLVLNAGSSSLKFSLFDVAGGDALTLSVHGVVDGIATPHARLRVADDTSAAPAPDHGAAFTLVAQWLDARLKGERPQAVGHRVVHGGMRYAGAVAVDDAVLADLEALTPLAPLHQPQALAAIRAVRAHWPSVPQVASFDTAFHRARPHLAQMFALPRELHEAGVRRYGFHGLSYAAITEALPRVAPDIAEGRVVIAHLGNGASLCAVRARRSVDTTMSFSALDGLPMGTRVGDLDPAVVLYLVSARGMSAAEVERLLYTCSGLFGVSGISGDVRELLASDEPRARLALDYFAYRIARETGALAASVGGIDGFVFTAGIGEHAAPVRASVCERLAWLGVRLDDAANARHGPRISALDSRVPVYVIPTDEEGVIARETLATLRRSSPRSAPGRPA